MQPAEPACRSHRCVLRDACLVRSKHSQLVSKPWRLAARPERRDAIVLAACLPRTRLVSLRHTRGSCRVELSEAEDLIQERSMQVIVNLTSAGQGHTSPQPDRVMRQIAACRAARGVESSCILCTVCSAVYAGTVRLHFHAQPHSEPSWTDSRTSLPHTNISTTQECPRLLITQDTARSIGDSTKIGSHWHGAQGRLAQ